MGYLSIVTIFILSLVDGLGLIYFLYSPQAIKQTFLIHVVTYIVIYLLGRKRQQEYKGVPVYIVFFMPGLGGIIVSVLFFSIAYFIKEGMVLEEYENYVSYNRAYDLKESVDYDKELRTLSFTDQMNLLESQIKKQLIIDASINYYANKVKILQKGLQDFDKEVQHYSAVSINVLENEFTLKINHLREMYNRYKDTDSLFELAKAYQEYIDSGLISGEILKSFNDEYIDILNKIIKIRKASPQILEALIKAYIHNGNLDKAEQTTYILLDLYSDWTRAIHFLIHIYNEKKDYESLKKLTSNLDNELIEVQKEYKDMIAFWKNRGELL